MADTSETIIFDGHIYLRYDGDTELLAEGEEPVYMVVIDDVIYVRQD